VRLILSNHKPDTLPHQIIIDFSQNMCILDSVSIQPLSSLPELDFHHPLFDEPIRDPDACIHTYVYDNFQKLTRSSRFVYSTLLQSKHPTQCVFVITPSVDYLKPKTTDSIFFSMHAKKMAKKSISLAMLSEFSYFFRQEIFHYQDRVILDKSITFDDLPDEVNGDLLYEEDLALIEFGERKESLEYYDIRYIHHLMGFGVFARKKINQGEWIGIYCGLKKAKGTGLPYYTYLGRKDCFELDTDAIMFGNFTRFINHADNPKRHDTLEPTLSYANLTASIRYINGQHFIVFIAEKEIFPGEQLLVDYGPQYFSDDDDQIFICRDGKIVNFRGKRIRHSFSKNKPLIQAMAKEGIPGALLCLLSRPMVSLLCMAFIYLILNSTN
jgi:hypothetical protein